MDAGSKVENKTFEHYYPTIGHFYAQRLSHL